MSGQNYFKLLLMCIVLVGISCQTKKNPFDNPWDKNGINSQVPETPEVTDPGQTAAYGSTYTITWRKANRALSYIIQEAKSSSFIDSVSYTIDDTTNTTKSFSKSKMVTIPTTYYYRVMAQNGVYTSAWSDTVDITVYPRKPDAPIDGNVTDIHSTILTLNWKDVSDNEQGFKIEKKDKGGAFAEIAVAAANTNSYQVQGLNPGNLYSFRIRAYNFTGYSDSLEISARTKGVFTISGTVSGTPGTTISLGGDKSDTYTVVSDGGSYSFTVDEAGSYTVTPSKTGYVFNPSSKSFINITANMTQNFTIPVILSGKVTGADGVTVTLSGDATGIQTVNNGGSYTFSVVYGGNYTVTPSKAGYTFTPVNKAYTNITASGSQDFTAIVTLTGKVTGADGVTVTLSGDETGSQTVNNGGSYSFTVQYGGNYTVTPSKVGYTFTPANKRYTNVTASVSQDFTALPGKIAFTSDRDGNNEIYVIDADGSNQTRLTNNSYDDRYPCWSPDGSKIAFVTNRDGNGEIYVMNADGSNQSKLTNNTSDTFPSWSPDGSQIAFVTTRNNPGEIYVMNSDGSNQRNLSNNTDHNCFPCWSPDGSKIVFSSDRDGSRSIYIMNADGSNQKPLTLTTSYEDDMPRWSPNGSQIIFTSNRDGNYEIYIINPDGRGLKNLTNSPDDEYWQCWSPDGNYIAFYSNRNVKNNLFIMKIDGTYQKNLTEDNYINVSPSWSK